MRIILSMLLGGVLLAGPGIISAEAARPVKDKAKASARKDPQQVLQKKDKDGDGSISLDEMKGKGKKDPAKVEARFKRLDRDKNGTISLAELKVGAKKKKKS